MPSTGRTRESNIVTAKRALAAFYGEGLANARDLAHEDFEFVEAPDVPDAARFSGENWFAALIERIGEVWEEPPGKFQAHEFIDLGEDVVVRGRLTLRGKTSGLSVTKEIAILFHLCDGRIKRVSNYPSVAAARAASSLLRPT